MPPTEPVAVDPSFVGLTDIIADWNASENAAGYNLDLSSDINFESFVTGFENRDVFNVTSYSITGLSANTTYYYRVRAYNIDGTSINSNVITVITLSDLPDPPLAPDSYSATDITQTNFTVNWSMTAAATSYRLDVSADITFSDFLPGFSDLEIQNAISLNIAGLNANSNYYYRVRASNSGGTSPNSEIVNVTTLPDPPLAPVSNEASDISQLNFTANWNISATAIGYFLDVADDEDFTVYVSGFNNLDVANISYYLVTGLDPNTVYYYRVRAYNEGGTSLNSTIIFVTTLSDPPAAPIANEASNIGQTDFMANWSASATATGYYLDVAEDINFTTIITDYNNLDVLNVLSYTITGLEINTTYYYRIRAYNSGGISGSSNIISVTTLLNPPDPPSAPIEDDATEISQTSFTANWSSTESATGYQLDVATDNSFTNFISGYNNLEILNDTSYEISGLTTNSYYYYRIRAYNSGGISPNSGTVEVIT
ncbi:MAG: fibronectin type III domain-containing protein, partial [Bacteroidales bacterium]|nr:fibronectin type III domain-containing protein [Bacteroidales bacterium]